MSDNRKSRRASEAAKRKPASQGQILQLQENVNRLNQRMNDIIEELQKILNWKKQTQNLFTEVENLGKTVTSLDAATAALGELADEKGLFTQAEIQNKLENLFDRQYGLQRKEYDGHFEPNDVLFITFKYMDENKKVISERRDPMMYHWGSNNLPAFEANAQGVELGKTARVEHQFPDDFHVKKLAGKKAILEFVVHEVRMKKPTDENTAASVKDSQIEAGSGVSAPV